MLKTTISIKELMQEGLLSVRSYSVLVRANFKNINEVENFTFEEIFMLRNCGRCAAIEILNLLETLKSGVVLTDLKKKNEISKLKAQAEKLQQINTNAKNTKVEKLLKLALNKACSYGELRNAVNFTIVIFARNNIQFTV